MVNLIRTALSKLVLLTAAAPLAGCIAPVSVTPGLCHALHAPETLQIRIVFGMALPGGQTVSEQQWQSFLHDAVTPLFPGGFVVSAGNLIHSEGDWSHGPTNLMTEEKSRILWIAAPPRQRLQHDVNTVRSAYMQRFLLDPVVSIQTGCTTLP